MLYLTWLVDEKGNRVDVDVALTAFSTGLEPAGVAAIMGWRLVPCWAAPTLEEGVALLLALDEMRKAVKA